MVMLVDDDPHSAAIFKLLMEHHHYPHLVAETPAIALDYLNTHRPDVVVIDLFLPEMDGFQTFSRIRELLRDTVCRFVATTAYYTNDTQQKVLAYGFDGYVAKPFIENSFFDALYGQPVTD
jgi:CheY-like chemotaxis protein